MSELNTSRFVEETNSTNPTNNVELSKREVKNNVISALETSELSRDFKNIVYNRAWIFLSSDISELLKSMTLDELVEAFVFLKPDFELRDALVWLDSEFFPVKNFQKKLENSIKNYALFYFANDEIPDKFNWIWELLDNKRWGEYLVSLINNFWKIDNWYFIRISREALRNKKD